MIGGHGGNIYQLARRLNCAPSDICDMSANVNPLGPMPELVEHLKTRLPAVTCLPEVDAGTMVEAFADRHGIDPATVTAGNGTTQLIYRIPRALGVEKTLVIGPTYADYRDACAMHGVACEHMICREADDFIPDMDAVRRSAASAGLVFLCNPNNPTGAMVDREAIVDLCRALPETLFVVDESYLPFAPNPEEVTLIRSDLPNLMVLNSMSKAFRIPGLRIGFVKAPADLLGKLNAFALPWSVNSLAQVAVQWLMNHPEAVESFLAATRNMIEREKRRTEECILWKNGARCFPSAASFVLIRLPRGIKAAAVWEHMAAHRILIRDCSNFTGLSDEFIRISMKSEDENQRAADLLIGLFRGHRIQRGEHGG